MLPVNNLEINCGTSSPKKEMDENVNCQQNPYTINYTTTTFHPWSDDNFCKSEDNYYLSQDFISTNQNYLSQRNHFSHSCNNSPVTTSGNVFFPHSPKSRQVNCNGFQFPNSMTQMELSFSEPAKNSIKTEMHQPNSYSFSTLPASPLPLGPNTPTMPYGNAPHGTNEVKFSSQHMPQNFFSNGEKFPNGLESSHFQPIQVGNQELRGTFHIVPVLDSVYYTNINQPSSPTSLINLEPMEEVVANDRRPHKRCTSHCCNHRLPEVERSKRHPCCWSGCDRSYGKSSHLKAHMRWHKGERPFKCNFVSCMKAFTRSDELQRHKRTHTGERNFECDICHKKFQRSDHLSKHKKTHPSVPPDSSSSKETELLVQDDTVSHSQQSTLWYVLVVF